MGTLFILLLLPLFSRQAGAQYYQLVWSDEFDGTTLDLSKWECMTGDGTDYGLPSGWGNNELQWYRPENAQVTGGRLIITAKAEAYGGKNYTSARIRTRHKGDWKYGRFEFGVKCPVGKGLWPAVWLLPTDNVYGGWAASGEIDIMEYLGHETNKVYGTLHYGGSWPQNTSSGAPYTLTGGTFSDGMHAFMLEWEEGVIRWFVDGRLYQTQTSWYSANGAFPAPFDQRFHLLINCAVGGNWPGSPDATTSFPQTLEIDYARVYQLNDTSSLYDKNPAPSDGYALGLNFLQPYYPPAKITYTLPKTGDFALKLYDLTGQLITNLAEGSMAAGSHWVQWEAKGSASGVYFCVLEAGRIRTTRKLYLQKK